MKQFLELLSTFVKFTARVAYYWFGSACLYIGIATIIHLDALLYQIVALFGLQSKVDGYEITILSIIIVLVIAPFITAVLLVISDYNEKWDKEHGYPKEGKTFNFPINPSVFKELNKDGKYARFTLSNILKAAFRGDNQFEFTDGGMSGTARINPETGEVEVTNTDEIAWEAANEAERQRWKNGGIGENIRYFMD